MKMLFVVLGLIFGSFGSVVVSRLPSGQSLLGRSQCGSCGRCLDAWELIPVISYILLRGRCSRCGKQIGIVHPALELLSAAAFYAAAAKYGNDILQASLLAVALWLLVMISAVDVRTRTIPDALNMPFILAASAFGIVAGNPIHEGMLLGGGFFAVQWIVSKGRWIGSGDVLMGIGAGAMVGSMEMAAAFIFLTYIAGAAAAGIMILSMSGWRKRYVAFAPFIAAAAGTTALFSEKIDMVLRALALTNG